MGFLPDTNFHQMALSSGPTQMLPGAPTVQSPKPSGWVLGVIDSVAQPLFWPCPSLRNTENGPTD